MLIRFYRTYKVPLFLMVVVVYGFWQLSFMQHIMKWDMVDDTFPKRFHISECLRHGFLPLWCPYQNLGLPIHADPSSYAWYPITWLISVLHGYDFYAMNFEFLLHIFIAGLAMFTLGRRLKLSTATSVFMATSYAFCGFCVGNAQHEMFIIAAAWLPFVLSSFFEMLETKTYRASLKTGFFLYLMFTGGYVTFTLVMAYVFLAILIYQFALHIIANRKEEVAPLAKRISLMSGTVILLSLAFLVSIYRVMPYFTRANALTLDLVMQNPFTFKSFVSFLFPYAVVAEPQYRATDVSMTNGYFGILTFILLLFTFFVKRNSKQLWFLLFGMFFLAVSMGPELPVRKWMYDYLPLMNLSRLPGLFRVLAITGFIVTAGFTLEEVINNLDQYRRKLILFTSGIAGFIAILVLFNFIGSGEGLFERAVQNCINVTWPSQMSLSEHIFVQGCIQLVILFGFILIIYKLRAARPMMYACIALLAADTMMSTQLNLAATVIYPVNLSESEFALKELPKGFPFSNSRKMIEVNDVRPNIQIPGLWANLNFFAKQPPYNGYTSFYLNQYDSFAHAPFLSAELSNPLVYLSGKVANIENLNAADPNDHLNLYFHSDDLASLSKDQFVTSPGDTVYITEYGPNKVTAKSVTKGKQLVTLMQNNFIGWKVLIDGQVTDIHPSNYACISAVLPAGDHIIEFIYRPTAVIVAAAISGLTFLAMIIYFLFTWLAVFRKPQKA